jgi:hypothetical protein
MAEGLRLGDNEKVTLNQRTLVVILVAMATAALAWADLKSDVKHDHGDMIDLGKIVAVDHDILIRLDQRTVWISENKSGAISAGVGPAPAGTAASTTSLPAH